MGARLDHTIVASVDAAASAAFLCEILDLAEPVRLAHFHAVQTGNGVSLDFATVDHDVVPQHYAFLVDEEDFDGILDRVLARDLQIWADPRQQRPGEISHGHGRGFYFQDPSGHYLEVLTQSYV